MKKLFRSILFFVVFCITANIISPCLASAENEFDYMLYSDEAVTEFSSDILTEISSGDDYISNRGHDETSLYFSPYWSMKINGESVPLYATAVYDWVPDRGVVQSFQYIFTDENAKLDIELTFLSGDIKNAVILPEKYGVTPQINGRKITAKISGFGAYTLLINDDSQEYAVTLFVKENNDEEKEIEDLKKEYGEENVTVFESGYYETDSISADKDVIYFRRGSFISFNHKSDIRSDADAESISLSPILELNSKDGAVIAGSGTFDFTRLDRRERNLITLNFCRNTNIEGLTLLNPNSWTVTAYACENCEFSDITVFGYRTNSDGINICGCNNVRVKDCFCRNGDDCFSAKATNEYYECHDITFESCIGWSCKARCFGITGEAEREIYNVKFSDCAVIFRNANWDTDRTASLAVAVETGGTDVHDITFENIEIHKDTGRPIYCMVYGDGIKDCDIYNIYFKNITVNCDKKIKISSQRNINFFGKIFSFFNRIFEKLFHKKSKLFSSFYEASNSVSVSFENVIINEKKIDRKRIKYFETAGNTELLFK